MKKMILLLAVIFAYSCSQENETLEELNTGAVDFSEMKLNLDFRISNKIFEYDDEEDWNSKLEQFTRNLQLESSEIIQEYAQVQNVVTLLEFKAGTAYLVGYAYVDDKGNIVESFSSFNKDEPLEETLGGAPCPHGYERIGRCSNFGNVHRCVSEHLAEFLSDNLDSTGDCANVQISVGTLSTTVCGQTC